MEWTRCGLRDTVVIEGESVLLFNLKDSYFVLIYATCNVIMEDDG